MNNPKFILAPGRLFVHTPHTNNPESANSLDPNSQERESALFERSKQNEFPHLIPNSQCIFGLALAQMGRVTEGIELIRKGLAGTRGIGSGVSISILYSYLAEAQRLGGATEGCHANHRTGAAGESR
jgi:hypothetical protein